MFTKLLFTLITPLMLLAGAAQADVIYSLNTYFSGSGLLNSPPWMSAQISQSGPSSVQLDISASGLAGPEYVNSIGLMYTGSASLLLTPLSPFDTGSYSTSNGLGFTSVFNFAPFTFNAFSPQSYLLSNASGPLSITDFTGLNSNTHSNAWASVTSFTGEDVQIINQAVIAAPEPMTYLALATFLLGVGYVATRRRLVTLA